MTFLKGHKINVGRKRTEEFKRKISLTHKGKIVSEETRKKLSLSRIGKKGRTIPEEERKAISKRMKNEKNPMWKGNDVGKEALHNWVHRRKPKPKKCVTCNERAPYDLANISGRYKRDINDFKWICRKCHQKEDGRLRILNNRRWGTK